MDVRNKKIETRLLSALLLVAGTAALPGQDAPPKQVPGLPPCPVIGAGGRALTVRGRKAVEVLVKMDVDVDGAPNAYGPKGKKTLDVLKHARAPKGSEHPGEVVGYMTDYEGGPATVQKAGDPFPGYYVSQTDFADVNNKRMEDPRRYVDATRMIYVVQGKVAREAGAQMGDFATVYSCRTGKLVYAILADSGNESGAEGSLALVRALGYPLKNGIDDSVNDREIVVRYFPGSNPGKHFFKSQAELDSAARKLGLDGR